MERIMRNQHLRIVAFGLCLGWTSASPVHAQPIITTQPSSQAVAADSSATLTVAVSGPGPFTYHWRFNGTNLPGIITTVAGNGTAGYSGDGGPAINAKLNSPQGVALDVLGNLYIGDFQNNRIRKVDTNGIITTVVGTGVQGFSGDGGAAISAKLTYPHGVAFDASGNLFFGDLGNYRIRKVDTNGIITTVVGTGTGAFGGDGGAATKARISWAQGVVLDDAGNLFLSDGMNNRIRKVDTNGIITTIAGKSTSGYSGDGGAATNAALSAPNGIALDRFGNVFLAGSGGIRKVGTNGIITTVAGRGFSGGPLIPSVLATNTPVQTDKGVAVDGSGNVFLCDGNRVRKVDTNGVISTVAGMFAGGYSGDGGAATNAMLSFPGFLALDRAGDLLLGDLNNNRIRKLTFSGGPTRVLSAVDANSAGSYDVVVTSSSGSVTSSVAVLTVLLPPEIKDQPANQSVAVGRSATFRVSATGTPPLNYQWFFEDKALVDQTNPTLSLANVDFSKAGKYTAVVTSLYGTVTSRVTFLTVGTPPTITTQPASQTVQPGANATLTTAVSGTGPFTYRWRFNGTQIPNTFLVAGTDEGPGGYSGDGNAATRARLNMPSSVVVDGSGNVFIADQRNNRIRKVDSNGIITTVAGTGYVNPATGNGGYSGDNGPATSARLNWPSNLALDGVGNLFIADSVNGRIRKVDTNGIITTVAGRTGIGAFTDGVLATSAYLTGINSLAVDASGNLFIADWDNNRIRKVDSNRIISTVAGNGTAGYSGDGGKATNAAITAGAIALDRAGNLFFADGNRVRKVATDGIISTVAGNGVRAYAGDGLAATDAELGGPWGLTVDAFGNVIITEAEGWRIRKVDAKGIRSTVATSVDLAPIAICADAVGNLFEVDASSRIFKISPSGPTLEVKSTTAKGVGNYDVVVTSPFGSVTSSLAVLSLPHPPVDIADDFSNGNDDGWTRYDALAGAFANYVPANFVVANEQYRISIPKPSPNPYGFVRALPYRADQIYTDFEVSANIAAWDNAGGSWFGVVGRMNQIGLNKTSGYLFWYRSDAKALFLNVFRGESGLSIALNQALTLDPTHSYRFTLTAVGERLTGTVVDLAAPDVVVAAMMGLSGLFPSGYCGVFCGGLGGADVTFDNIVARTPTPTPPSLSLTSAPGVGFEKPARYTTGLFPHGIDKGDLNRDGVLDLVISNSRGGNVTVFLGETNGTFTKHQDYSVGSGPLSPTIARLNGDDFPDLVVANGSSTNVSVLLGQSDGTLSDKVNFTVGSRPASIGTGDFNKDGVLDLVTANSGSTNVSLLLGNGDGTFKDKLDLNVGRAPLVVRTVDFNGDGMLDLVTANSGDDTVSILLGRGDGTFQDQVFYAVGRGPSSIAIGDFNGDARPDVVVVSRSVNSVTVLPGLAGGTLGPALSTSFVLSPLDLAVADMDGDGIADLVVTTSAAGSVALLIGNGDGSFGGATLLLDLGDNCSDATVADFNHDSRPDLAVVCQFGDRLEVLFNRGKPAVATPAIELRWSLPADGYVVESTDVLPGAWTTINASPSEIPGQQRALSLPRTGNAKYFRLHKP